MRVRRRVGIGVCLLACALGRPAQGAAGQGRPVPLADRARGAERVVVGRVTAVDAIWRINDFGDRLIVSVVHVAVDETLKGAAQASVDVEVEGGTIGTLTLRVSDEQSFVRGDRAVFFLRRSARGHLVPHLRGEGLLKLDRANRVPGSSLTLDEIRRTVAAGH
ncbi:MAG TPA: hypothetical protein VH458_22850 [Vicinamibacterales bacterium]